MALPVNQVAASANIVAGAQKKIAGMVDAQGFENCLAGQIGKGGMTDMSTMKEFLAGIMGEDVQISDAMAAEATQLFQLLQTLKQLGMSTADIKTMLGGGMGGQTAACESGSDIQALLSESGSDAQNLLASMGLGSQDMKNLLATLDAGNSVGGKSPSVGPEKMISDSGLQVLLQSLGLSAEKINTIMGNTELKAGLKMEIANSLQELAGFKVNMGQGTANTDSLHQLLKNADLELSTEELKALESQLRSIVAGSENIRPNDTKALSALVAEITKSDQSLTAALNEAKQIVPQMDNNDLKLKLKNMITQAMQNSDNKLHVKIDANASASAASMSDSKVVTTAVSAEKTVDILKNEIGIDNDVLKKLFFSTDKQERQGALAKITDQLGTYLSDGKNVGKELHQALSTIRQATTKEEWAGIQDVLKQLQPGLQLTDQKTLPTESFMKELASKLGAQSEGTQNAYTDKTIDQIRFQLPTQLKGGQGAATIELNPPLLGKVEVNVVMEDGKMHATFRAESQIARDIIHSNMSILKDSLADQGIRVAQINVSAGLDQRQQEHAQQQSIFSQFETAKEQHGRSGQHGGQSGSKPGSGQGDGIEVYREDAIRARINVPSGLDLFA